jgi:hypothetical protein
MAMVTKNAIVPEPGLAASSTPVEITTGSLVPGVAVESGDGSVEALVSVVAFACLVAGSVVAGSVVAGSVVAGSADSGSMPGATAGAVATGPVSAIAGAG